jgi:hypothetical protein
MKIANIGKITCNKGWEQILGPTGWKQVSTTHINMAFQGTQNFSELDMRER